MKMILLYIGVILLSLGRSVFTAEESVGAEDGSSDCAACDDSQLCVLGHCVLSDDHCPDHMKWGPGPPASCEPMVDPNQLPPSPMESWFTRELFDDLFPKANIGWGPHECLPYNYDAFVIAARYFPAFGSTHNPENGFTEPENFRRDLAAFFSHAVQETGENDASLYKDLPVDKAHACFYRGGFFNWFEGGPKSSFMDQESPGFRPEDGEQCNLQGKYCSPGAELEYWYPCNEQFTNETGTENEDVGNNVWYKGCYFGRGAIQISYNYNYGQFSTWLNEHGIYVNLLENPNLVITHRQPPLAVLASLWFYMTPQPPKPAMHDIVMGRWEPGDANRAAGYSGAMFGPTSLIINAECNGEDDGEPGGPGESRRIKAYKWFAEYFDFRLEEEKTLSCGDMPVALERIPHALSYQPDWQSNWKEQVCACAPAEYGGVLPYFQPGFYPEEWVRENERMRYKCVKSVYDNPEMYSMNNDSSPCLNYPMPLSYRMVAFEPEKEEVIPRGSFKLASRGSQQIWKLHTKDDNN